MNILRGGGYFALPDLEQITKLDDFLMYTNFYNTSV